MQNIACKVTMEINAPMTKVWEALTKPELIKQYFFGMDTVTDWQVGSPVIFQGVYEGKQYLDKGTVLEVNPNRTLRYSYWSSMSGLEDKPENYVPVTYSLTEAKDLTVVTVTQENLADEKTKVQHSDSWKKVLAGMKSLLETRAEPAY